MRQDKRKTGDKQKGKQKGNQGQADDKTKKQIQTTKELTKILFIVYSDGTKVHKSNF